MRCRHAASGMAPAGAILPASHERRYTGSVSPRPDRASNDDTSGDGLVVLGAVVQASRRSRLALMRATALTFGLLLALAPMELAAASRLVHWELVLTFARGEQQY